MGMSRLDIGGAEVAAGGRKALKDGSKVLAEATGFKFKTSQAGNPMIAVTYKVTDEKAEDVDGGQDFGRLFDNIVFSEKAVKMAKSKLLGLQYDGVSDLVIEDVEDVKDLASDLQENYVGTEVVLVTENEEYNDKVSSKVRFVNAVD